MYSIFEMYKALFPDFYKNDFLLWFIQTMADIGYFAFIGAWLCGLIYLTGNPFFIKPRIVAFATAAIGIIIEIFTFTEVVYLPYIGGHSIRIAIVCLNFIFDALVLAAAIYILIHAFMLMDRRSGKRSVILLDLLLVLYMIYVFWWDYNCWTVDSFEESNLSDFDPMLFIYCICCIMLLHMVRKKKQSPIGYAITKAIGIDNDKDCDWGEISRKYKLTMREIEICQLICKGISNSDIAQMLFISESTVKHHITSIFSKTGIKGRYELLNIIEKSK